MQDQGSSTVRHLNRANRWAGFVWKGLELGRDGALRLASLPLAGELPPDLADLDPPAGPAGVVAVPGGDVYFTDPDGHRLLVVDGCGGAERPLPCLVGRGDGPDQLDTPRGLAYHRSRGALLVADSGNHRIQVIDLPSLQLAETWGGPGDGPGALRDPRSLACDPAGNLYVVDHGNRRVQKLDELGQPVAAFWEAVRAGGDLAPAEVAVGEDAAGTVILILDATTGLVHLVDPDGHRRARDPLDTALTSPTGLAGGDTAVYVGDNTERRLAVFGYDASRTGSANGYRGPVAAVALDPRGGLLLHPGWARPPLQLARTGAYRARGLLWGGPVHNPSIEREPWHLLRATAEPLPDGAHLQLYLAANQEGDGPPVQPDDADPFADPGWRRLPVASDATETLFPGEPYDQVWVAAVLSSEGLATPVLSQLRLEFAHHGYLGHLPAVYSKQAAARAFLARWLALFESVFDSVHDQVEGLATLFDPAAAPARYLPWLVGWLGAELPEEWDEPRKRRTIAEAFASHGQRGTVAGLQEALRAQAGVEALIEEPINQTSWWALPGDSPSEAEAALSVLGAGTVLAVGEASGAVAGTSAVLDGSFLAPQEDYATALFADVANQFIVRVYRGRGFSQRSVTTARALLQREAPAHTRHHLCVVEPRLRVGVQARLGIDAVVAGPPAPTPLDGAAAGCLVLGGAPGGRLGADSHVGRTHLTQTTGGRPAQ